ncbi:hypothetical protein M408DRAFT_78446 [Serendipita vermifera MAFF 305830]|uniref:Uncharacterized protein n=1 Tax=Serendipita vermifera MAFF 305830 TaxID=933852 RepID=A0A0C2WZV9_SERVB|nr:hypothetical protein M408DRAFT_78446 [Serendipita vermifera MAFF 305830]
MPTNVLAENIFGTIGTILWSGQIIPQIYKSYREKTTAGLSGLLMLLWAVSGAFLGVYTIVRNINIPLIVQPQVFGALAALSWVQTLYYDPKRSLWVCSLIFLTFVVVFAAFEAGMVYATRAAIEAGNQHVLPFFGGFSAVLIAVALIPQYIEIYRLKEVRGISLLFMALDIGGGIFSLLSLVFKPEFDGVASLSYIGVIVLDGIIVILQFILNPRAQRRREREDAMIPEITEHQNHDLTLGHQDKMPVLVTDSNRDDLSPVRSTGRS